MAFFKQPECLTNEDVLMENLKSIALAIVIGIGFAVLLVIQLSK